jgi:allophanate hydrolase subunit 2
MRGVVVHEREEVDTSLLVVEGEDAVGEQEDGVRQRRPVDDRAAAVGLQLVAEVADEPAVEVERELLGIDA